MAAKKSPPSQTLPVPLFYRFLLYLSMLCLPLSAQASDTSAVFTAINERLSFMTDVARYKALHSAPVEDKEREARVIDQALHSAAAKGLDAPSTEAFFRAQIIAAKAIQYRYRADYLLTPALAQHNVPNLISNVRPKLLQLGEKIINGIAAKLATEGNFSEIDRPLFMRLVQQQYLSQADKDFLFQALLQIKRAP